MLDIVIVALARAKPMVRMMRPIRSAAPASGGCPGTVRDGGAASLKKLRPGCLREQDEIARQPSDGALMPLVLLQPRHYVPITDRGLEDADKVIG